MKRVLGSDSPKNQFEVNAQFESAEQKAERNRERNREHAKKTRLRKKEMIEGMKIRLLELQRESARLEQLVEESNTASILLCLGGKQEVAAPSSSASPMSSIANSPISFGRSNEESTALSSNKRRRMGSDGEETSTVTEGERKESEPGLGLSVSLMKGNIIDQLRQKVRVEAAKNFNKGDYGFFSSSSASSLIMDEGDEDDDSSVEANHKPNSSSTSSHSTDDVDNEVQNRRARNRMHAKLTRDRKKLLTNKMQETILFLESRNEQLKSQLDQMMKSSVNVSAQHQSPPQHQHLSQSQPNAAVAFAMPTLYGNIPFEQKMSKGYDPLTAFCYFAEVWNQAMEGRAHPSSSKPKTIPTF